MGRQPSVKRYLLELAIQESANGGSQANITASDFARKFEVDASYVREVARSLGIKLKKGDPYSVKRRNSFTGVPSNN